MKLDIPGADKVFPRIVFCIALVLLAIVNAGCGKKISDNNADAKSCADRLEMIEQAKQVWADQNHKNSADIPTLEDLRPYMRGGDPHCPSGGAYAIGSVGELPSCSIAEHTAYFKSKISRNQ